MRRKELDLRPPHTHTHIYTQCASLWVKSFLEDAQSRMRKRKVKARNKTEMSMEENDDFEDEMREYLGFTIVIGSAKI